MSWREHKHERASGLEAGVFWSMYQNEQGVEMWEGKRRLPSLHLHCGFLCSSDSQCFTSCWQKGTEVAMAT